MSDRAGAHIRLTGRVQMVGFRWFVRQWAEDMALDGWVRNNTDGSVETEVEGNRDKIEALITELKQGPKQARVKEVNVDWLPFENRFHRFEIRY